MHATYGVKNGNVFRVPNIALKAEGGVVLNPHTHIYIYISTIENPYLRCSQGYDTSSTHTKKHRMDKTVHCIQGCILEQCIVAPGG